jgi:hypothetical protein
MLYGAWPMALAPAVIGNITGHQTTPSPVDPFMRYAHLLVLVRPVVHGAWCLHLHLHLRLLHLHLQLRAAAAELGPAPPAASSSTPNPAAASDASRSRSQLSLSPDPGSPPLLAASCHDIGVPIAGRAPTSGTPAARRSTRYLPLFWGSTPHFCTLHLHLPCAPHTPHAPAIYLLSTIYIHICILHPFLAAKLTNAPIYILHSAQSQSKVSRCHRQKPGSKLLPWLSTFSSA